MDYADLIARLRSSYISTGANYVQEAADAIALLLTEREALRTDRTALLADRQRLIRSIDDALAERDRLREELAAAKQDAASWEQQAYDRVVDCNTFISERDDALKMVRLLREELESVLADWNALVVASGSPTNGGAIGFVTSLRSERDRLRGHIEDIVADQQRDQRQLSELRAELAAAKQAAGSRMIVSRRLDWVRENLIDDRWTDEAIDAAMVEQAEGEWHD